MLKRIIQIDDDPILQQITKTCFERQGDFIIEAFSSGIEALEHIPAFAPDVILLDYRMPDMDGPEVLQALQNAPETASIPVIFLSGANGIKEQIGENGVIGFIQKPFIPKDFVQTVEQMWQAHQS